MNFLGAVAICDFCNVFPFLLIKIIYSDEYLRMRYHYTYIVLRVKTLLCKSYRNLTAENTLWLHKINSGHHEYQQEHDLKVLYDLVQGMLWCRKLKCQSLDSQYTARL